MKRKSMATLVAGLLVALGVLMTGAARAPVAHAAATTPIINSDPVGDQLGNAADIQWVAVSNDGSVVTLTIHAPGFVLHPGDMGTAIGTWINTDRNSATGDPFDGTDFGVVTRILPDGPEQVFLKWDATASPPGWVEMTASPTMTYSEDTTSGTYTFTFDSADFGGTTAFDFYAVSTTAAGPGFDVAPDDGPGTMWTYELTTPPVTPPLPIMQLPDGNRYLYDAGEYHLISQAQFDTFGLSAQAINYVGELYQPVGAPATDEQVQAMEAAYVQALNDMGIEATVPAVKAPAPSPAPTTPAVTTPSVVESPVINPPVTFPVKAQAGKYFTVSFPIKSSVTGQTLTTGTMICDPSVKSKVIPHFEHFKNGMATLRFVIPTTAKGKLLKVHLTMVLGGQSTTRIESFLVR